MADLKQTLFTYLAHRHIDLMPPDVADRFDDYAKNKSFIGHMKDWNDKYYGKPIAMLDTTITSDGDWEKVYDSCQDAMQQMYENKNHPVGIGSDYNPATKGFIDGWFGPNPNKTFTYANATSNTNSIFKKLATFLKAHPELKSRFTNNLQSVFNDITYDKFCDKLKDEEYNKDPKFKDKVQAVIQYIKDYGPQPGYPEHPDIRLWPAKCGYDLTASSVVITAPELQPILYDSTTPAKKGTTRLDEDPEKWYEIPKKPEHIDWFKRDYVKFFDEILTNSAIRAKFLEKADDPIATALRVAIEDTDYENKDSDDFVRAKPLDSKNWLEKIKKWKDDTYENHFRRFTNPSRGTRKFFSPHSQNIMKGFDKAGIKPTDGLEGILAKKDDAKLQNTLAGDSTTPKHFKWLCEKLEELKKETPDDFKGALRDGKHLQNLVINLIIKASKETKMNEAMTALEVLSVAKYGLLSSRTFNSIHETAKNLKIFSDEKMSYMNGNKAVGAVFAAFDRAIGATITATAAIATVTRNFVSHRRTKIDKYISKYENLNDYYTNWTKEDKKRHQDLRDSNKAHDVENVLSELDNPSRVPVITGPHPTRYQTPIQINKDNIGTDDDPTTIKGKLKAARDAGETEIEIGTQKVNIEHLQNDVDLFDDVYGRQKQDTEWRDKNPDIVHDLVAYWNMLETTTKTHTFKLGNMKVMRDELLKDFDLKKKSSQAQKDAWDYIKNYGALSYTP